ncbi:MAG: hypothetical protein N2Z73_00985, partial [Endomicrobia bacterium]|nr:hypothetical protein [Endomicrobiia bacterium]
MNIVLLLILTVSCNSAVLTDHLGNIMFFTTEPFIISVSTKSIVSSTIVSCKPTESSFGQEKVSVGFSHYIHYSTWSENPKLLNPQVKPTNAPPGSAFEFSVVYKDEDPPKEGFPKVRIYKDGGEIPASPIVLSYSTGSFAYGALFSTNVVLQYSSQNYEFYCYTYDYYGFYAETARINGPTVNFSPQLLSYNLNPVIGTENTTFYFSVVYQDLDNDPPMQGYPKIYIINKQNSSSTTVTMEFFGGSYSLSAVYSSKVSLPAGVYEFYFFAKDIFGNNSNILFSTSTFAVNSPCLFQLVSYTEQVAPYENFSLTAKYIDFELDPPTFGYPKVIFYLNDEVVLQDTMVYQSGSFNEGALYFYTTQFSTVSKNY